MLDLFRTFRALPRAPLQPVHAWRALMLSCLSLATNVHAQEVAPGLWEVSTQIKMPSNPALEAQMAQAQAHMNKLPPEVRKQLEKSTGVSLNGAGAPGTTTLRLCMSPEQAKAPSHRADPKDNCTYQETQRKGNVVSGRITCSPPAGSGEFSTTIHSKKHYSTQGKMSSPQGLMHFTSEAKFISAECGSLTPMK